MKAQIIMFCYFAFMVGTILNLAIEGSWIGGQEVSMINQLTGYTNVEIQSAGVWAIPKQVAGFFSHGIPKLIAWDYSYLDSGFPALFKWTVLYAISAGVVFGVVQLFVPVIQGLVTSIRSLLPF